MGHGQKWTHVGTNTQGGTDTQEGQTHTEKYWQEGNLQKWKCGQVRQKGRGQIQRGGTDTVPRKRHAAHAEFLVLYIY